MWGDSQCLLMGMKNHSHGEGGGTVGEGGEEQEEQQSL